MKRLLLALLLIPALSWGGTITSARTGGVAEQDTTCAGSCVTLIWETLTTANDTGVAIQYGAYGDRTVQLVGTWGTGGTVVIQGSLDGTTYATLTDVTGNALSFTANGLKAVSEAVRYIRPKVTGGDGTTDVDVYIFMRK